MQVVVIAAALAELLDADGAHVEHELRRPRQRDGADADDQDVLDPQAGVGLNPHQQRRADRHADQAAAAALGEEQQHDDRAADRKQRREPQQSLPRDQQRREAGQDVAEVRHLVDEGAPTADLSTRPRRRPAVRAQIGKHFRNVEVDRVGEVQHAEDEADRHQTHDRWRFERTVGDVDQPARRSPGLAQDADPHRRGRYADADERVAQRLVRRLPQVVGALQQVQQQPEHEADHHEVLGVGRFIRSGDRSERRHEQQADRENRGGHDQRAARRRLVREKRHGRDDGGQAAAANPHERRRPPIGKHPIHERSASACPSSARTRTNTTCDTRSRSAPDNRDRSPRTPLAIRRRAIA